MANVHYLELLAYIEEYIDVEKLLYMLGAKHVKVYGSNIRSECVIHGGDNVLAFSYDLNKKVWSCFSNNCGEGYRRNLYDLVYLYLLKQNSAPPTEKEVFTLLLQATDVKIELDEIEFGFSKPIQDKFDNILFATRVKQRYNKKSTKNNLLALDESIINCYNITVHPYLINRGLTPETIQFFDLRYAPQGLSEKNTKNFPGRIIIPIRSIDNKLLGLSGRLATDDKKIIKQYSKYKHLYSFPRNSVLYNANHALPYIKKTKAVILVEGFFDVIGLWQKDIKNVVAAMGNSITIQQVQDLLPYLNKVYVCFDGDKGGRDGVKKVARILGRLCSIYNVRLPEGKDPDELSKTELVQSILQAKKII